MKTMKFYNSLLSLLIFLFLNNFDNVGSVASYSRKRYATSGYCSSTYKSLCGSGANHVGCVTRGFSARCAPGTEVMPMTSQMRSAFLHHHNSLRSQVAMGHIRGYPPATRMATMSWSDELANLAALNVYQCEIEHDQCRATLAFRTPGQNLCTRSGPYETLHGVINRCINAWFEEKTIAKPSYVDYLVVEPHFKQYGHFTQMVVDKAYKVGCAVVRSPSSYYGKRYFLACNYSASQVIGRPLYVRGKTGKYCSAGRNSYYPGLCNPNEQFPSN